MSSTMRGDRYLNAPGVSGIGGLFIEGVKQL